MRKLWLFAICVSLIAGLFLTGCSSEPEQNVLNIGSMSPLTGPYAADGNDIANGARAAIDTVMAEGGIPGFTDIVLHPQDTACDPKQAVAAANKLINEKVVGVVGAYCSSSTIPASETLAEENIIVITPASTSPKVTERGLPFMFRMCGRDDDQGPSAVRFMKDHLKAKSIFIVDDKTTYSQGLADQVEKNAREMGIKVLAHDHVNQGDKDYSAVLTKVKQANPDVFYISLQNSATGALMLIQAARMGIDAAMIGQDAVYHPQLIEIAKQSAEGAYLTFGFMDKKSDSYMKFEKAYSKYGKPGAYSAYAYDSAMVLLDAIKKSGSTDANKIRETILGMSIDGASKKIKFKENGDSGSNYVIFKVKDGAFVPYYDPNESRLF